MKKENKIAAFKADESRRYGDYAIVEKDGNYGILNTVTGSMPLSLKYDKSYEYMFAYDYIIITNHSKITIYDTQEGKIIVEDYILSERNANELIVQDPETRKYYQINIEKLREEGLQGPCDDSDEFFPNLQTTRVTPMAKVTGNKMAIYSAWERITDYNIKKARAYEKIIICTDDNGKMFFMAPYDRYSYSKSPRFDSVTIGKIGGGKNDTPILTCKTGDEIIIYVYMESDTPIIFNKHCDSATVVKANTITSDIEQYIISYEKDGLEGFSMARVTSIGNVRTNDIFPAKRNIKTEAGAKSSHVIGERILDNNFGTAVVEDTNEKGMVANTVLSAGRYYYRTNDGELCVAEIKDSNVETVKLFDGENVEETYLIDENLNSTLFISSKDGKKIFTIVQGDKIYRSAMYDDVVRLTKEGYLYFLGTKEGKRVLLANGFEVPFKCYDQNTGMESTELSSDKIIFTKGFIGSTVILNQRALNLPQQKLEELENVTFGEKSFVAGFANSTVVADYDAKPLIQFLSRKTLKPKMVNLGDIECELYKDKNSNWYGPSENVSEPIEYLVPSAALIKKGKRKHLINPEVDGEKA